MIKAEFDHWTKKLAEEQAKYDMLLADVRALVDESKLSLNWLASYPGENANKAYERLRKAIAAVERHFSSKTSQP